MCKILSKGNILGEIVFTFVLKAETLEGTTYPVTRIFRADWEYDHASDVNMFMKRLIAAEPSMIHTSALTSV